MNCEIDIHDDLLEELDEVFPEKNYAELVREALDEMLTAHRYGVGADRIWKRIWVGHKKPDGKFAFHFLGELQVGGRFVRFGVSFYPEGQRGTLYAADIDIAIDRFLQETMAGILSLIEIDLVEFATWVQSDSRRIPAYTADIPKFVHT